MRSNSVFGFRGSVFVKKKTISSLSKTEHLKPKTTLLGLLTSLLISSIAFGSTYFDDHQRGWHWYEILKQQEKEKQKAEVPQDPIKALNQLQKSVETAKSTAIMQPTEANLKIYIELQNQVAKQSSMFAEQWQRVLWKYPELDYSLVRPTGLLAKQTYMDEHKESMKETVRAFAKTHGLWFFFRGSCGYCHHFAPILKRIAHQYGFQVMAISLDGGVLSEFPNATFNQGQVEKLGVEFVPAVFAVDPKTEEIIPLSHGLVSEEEFLERIWQLTWKESL